MGIIPLVFASQHHASSRAGTQARFSEERVSLTLPSSQQMSVPGEHSLSMALILTSVSALTGLSPFHGGLLSPPSSSLDFKGRCLICSWYRSVQGGDTWVTLVHLDQFASRWTPSLDSLLLLCHFLCMLLPPWTLKPQSPSGENNCPSRGRSQCYLAITAA